jgi:hypothetical protein
MIWTGVAQGCTMAILAGLYNTVATGNKAAQGVSVLMLFLFNTWFSIGWLGMTWLYPAEVTPLRIRAAANALSTATNWLFNFFGTSICSLAILNWRLTSSCHGCWANVCQYRVRHLRLLRCHESRNRCTGYLVPLPRDQEVLPRRRKSSNWRRIHGY